MTVTFRAMLPEDVLALEVQPSQVIGLAGPVRSIERGRELVEAGPAWTALDEAGRPIVVAGIGITFAGVQGVAWALLTARIGPAHLAITRFARRQIAGAGLRRIEAIICADQPGGCRWAELVGLTLNTVLYNWGPDSRPHLLMERVR